ncbi:M48 family metallopeptidase [Massilia sp. PAMC28688]|uniref:M48 family metallopeptidase n=1 Tax=Massilia sp. PAMC28688 TaxID=2861283 RepID=UPI001C62C855|nr:M48 family metallopeptidase [Massilia sp. PAMC28688]QYF94561.1 M48 family metallopeptidase [Massilia sp. PAMC28688]
MNQLRKIVVAVSLAACAGMVPVQAQQQAPRQDQATVQDGIQLRPMPRYRMLASEERIEAQSKAQYAQMMQQAAQKGALAPSDHPQVIRLRNIARRIIPHTTRWNPAASKWDWQVNLIGSQQINAFCMPGGRIGFFSGILTQLKLTDDEAAAIMGHEIAHALREHGREQMVKSTATNVGARLGGAVLAAVLGIDPGITDTVAQYGAQFASLKFSRDDEREADLIGLDIAARAGYDPRAGIVLWQKMAQASKGSPPEFLSTHPGGANRIRQMQEHMDVLLPLYARAKGTTTRSLPPYRSVSIR